MIFTLSIILCFKIYRNKRKTIYYSFSNSFSIISNNAPDVLNTILNWFISCFCLSGLFAFCFNNNKDLFTLTRELKNGEQTDIYGVVIEGLKKLKPGVSSISYEEFRSCLKEIIDDVPQLHEISRVLEKIAEISYNAGASSPVIDWDKDEAILTITDPFFAFYLRWCPE